MKQLVLLIANIFFLFAHTSAQTAELSLLSTAGGEFITDNIQLQFTIGEVITETFASSDLILSQGFLQPTKTSTNIYSTYPSSFNVKLYPNPATYYLTLNISINNNTLLNHIFYLEIFDINGKSLQKTQTSNQQTTLPLSSFCSGTYLIKISTKQKNESQTIYKQIIPFSIINN